MAVQLNISKASGGNAGNVDVSDAAFGRDYNESLIHQVVVAYMAGARAGTKAQKNRSAVSGGGAKPWRQKGTGRARAGTIRSNIFRGGGRAFPGAPRDFSQKVNRKMYRAAMQSIMSELHRQERLVVVDELALDAPKTKVLSATLEGLNASGALVVLSADNQNVELAARNLKYVAVCNAAEIDPVSLISHDKVVVTAEAIKQIDEALQ